MSGSLQESDGGQVSLRVKSAPGIKQGALWTEAAAAPLTSVGDSIPENKPHLAA